MVSYYGMGNQLGNMSFYDSSGQSEYSFTKPYSDKTSEGIDREAFDLVNKSYRRAKEILTEHKDGLKQLAELLLEKEVIFTEDLENIFGKRQFKKEGEGEKTADEQAENVPLRRSRRKNVSLVVAK